MKTRILYTKFWEDEFISSLTLVQKALFMYFITNQRIGQTGIYEITDRIILFETGATKDQLEQTKAVFSKANKILFIEGWVKVINSGKYNAYTGENNDKARIKELESIPEEILTTFDTPSEGVDTPSIPVEGTTNHNKKSLIITKGVVKGDWQAQLAEMNLSEIAEKYQVPLAFVTSKLDDLDNWISEKPTRARGRDLHRTLMAWVKKDAMERRENVKSKIAYVGDTV